ncbi:MAG: hypothetical protein WA323_19090, partial [Candidatus Nitrosopolaris sp.]
IQVKKLNDIQVGRDPFNVVINPASGVLYVTTLGDRSIDEISLSSNKLEYGFILTLMKEAT